MKNKPAIRDDLSAAAEKARNDIERRQPRGRRTSRRILPIWVKLLVVVVLIVVFALNSKKIIKHHYDISEQSLNEQQTRLLMVNMAERLDAWKVEKGHLPENLTAFPDVEYTLIDGQYTVSVGDGDSILTLKEGQDIEQFIDKTQ
jgi:hypothetical protein